MGGERWVLPPSFWSVSIFLSLGVLVVVCRISRPRVCVGEFYLLPLIITILCWKQWGGGRLLVSGCRGSQGILIVCKWRWEPLESPPRLFGVGSVGVASGNGHDVIISPPFCSFWCIDIPSPVTMPDSQVACRNILHLFSSENASTSRRVLIRSSIVKE